MTVSPNANGPSRHSASRPDLVSGLVQDLRRAEEQVAELQRQLGNRDIDIRALEQRVAAAERHVAMLAAPFAVLLRGSGMFRRGARFGRRVVRALRRRGSALLARSR